MKEYGWERPFFLKFVLPVKQMFLSIPFCFYFILACVSPAYAAATDTFTPTLTNTPTATNSATPSSTQTFVINTIRIQNEDYDPGAEGTAYHDLTAGNDGGQYRAGGVDIYYDASAGYYVGGVFAGEWINYTVNFPADNSYTITCRLSAPSNGGVFHIESDGVNITGAVSVPSTGSWTTFTNKALGPFAFTAGPHVLKFSMDTNGASGAVANFNYFDITFPGTPTNTPTNSPVYSPTCTPTRTQTWTATNTFTNSPTPTQTTTFSASPTFTATLTITSTFTPRDTPTPLALLPARIQCEDYDLGGEGSAYHDTTAGNAGGQYRSDNVDIGTCADTGGGYTVGWAVAGEWLDYTVNILQDNNYSISFRVAQGGTGGVFHLECDGVNITGPVNVPNTGGWGTYTTLTKTNISLAAGTHVLKLALDTTGTGGGTADFNYFDIALQNTPTATPTFTPIFTYTNTPTRTTTATASCTATITMSATISQTLTPANTPLPLALPARIQSEDYDAGAEGQAYHDLTPGNDGGQYRGGGVDIYYDSSVGYYIGGAFAGEWLDYTVNVPYDGAYVFKVSIAAPSNGGVFHVESDGIDVTGPVGVPNTGSWLYFDILTMSQITLAAGTHVLRFVLDTNGSSGAVANFNFFDITFPMTPTQTPTFTPFISQTFTRTATATGTLTQTPEQTATDTPQDTATAAATATLTHTAVDTATATSTLTPADTPTQAWTPSMTGTLTSANTSTRSATMTATQSFTRTGTVTQTMTAVNTATATIIPATATVTVTGTPYVRAGLDISGVIAYPNPAMNDGAVTVKFAVNKHVSKIEFKLFTASYRLVLKSTQAPVCAAGEAYLNLGDGALKGLSSGTYYFSAVLYDDSGSARKAKAGTLLVFNHK